MESIWTVCVCVHKDNCFLKGFPESGGVVVCVRKWGFRRVGVHMTVAVLVCVCVPGEEAQKGRSVCACMCVHRKSGRDLKSVLKRKAGGGLKVEGFMFTLALAV